MDHSNDTGSIITADGRRLYVAKVDDRSATPFTIGCSPDGGGRGFAVSLSAFEFEALATLIDRIGAPTMATAIAAGRLRYGDAASTSRRDVLGLMA